MNPSGGRIINWHGHQWVCLLTRIYLGLVFIIASWHKIIHPEMFALDVATYQLLPLWAINGFALVLPWMELIAGTMLILGMRARAAALLAALMMLSFMVALLWTLYLGLDMACGCFASQAAVTDDPISWYTVTRDIFWLALALYVLTFDQTPLNINRIFFHRKVGL
jgi:putative oxidoreductase